MEEQIPMTEFELARELNKLGFVQQRRDDSWYYIRPDLLIQLRDTDCLYAVDKRPPHNFFENAIYYPTIEDFENYLQEDLQQMIQTNRSGWFAYVNGLTSDSTIKGGGTTVWLALANACYAKMLTISQKPEIADTSENAQASKEPAL